MFQVIDMHCDTIPALQWKEKQEHLADADLQINLDKLEKGGSLCQCFSLFTFLKGLKDETPFEHVRESWLISGNQRWNGIRTAFVRSKRMRI